MLKSQGPGASQYTEVNPGQRNVAHRTRIKGNCVDCRGDISGPDQISALPILRGTVVSQILKIS